MQKVIRQNNIPQDSIIAKGFGAFHYCDSYCINIQANDNIDKLTTNIFKSPDWAITLMKIRNALVSLVGLRAGGLKEDSHPADYYPIGSRAVYFTVIDRNDNEILMEEKDRHLNFRVSVKKSGSVNNLIVNLTTLVQYNNFGGRLYFTPVKPFHRLIIKSTLKRLQKQYNPSS